MVGREARAQRRVDLSGFFDAIHTFTVYGTLLFLGLVCCYLVIRDFGVDPYAGVRSVAATFFPVIITSFLFLFGKELFEQLGEVPPGWCFVVAGTVAIVLMLVLQIMSETSALPLAPLLLASCFAVLAFSTGALRDNRHLPSYYGFVAGVLLYVVFFGFPLMP